MVPVNSDFHGSRYGKGIYFSDSFALSSWYSPENCNEKYIFLCEVALGNMVNILSMGNTELKESESYDSVRAMSSSGPDWDGFIKKGDVIYPIGDMISYPLPEYTPYISDKMVKLGNKLTPLQAHFDNKIKSQRINKKVKKKRASSDYDEDQDTDGDQESDEEDMDIGEEDESNVDNINSEASDNYLYSHQFNKGYMTQVHQKGNKKVIISSYF